MTARCHWLLPILCCTPFLRGQESRPDRLLVLELDGTPFERGLAHGKALREQIGDLLGAFRKDLQGLIGGDAATGPRRFLGATRYEPAIRRHTPSLLDEVRGIAQGAGQAYEDLLAYQLIDEIWAQSRILFGHKCTTIGVDRSGTWPAFVAQNIDLPGWMHAHPTVLRIRHPDRDLESLVVTLPGFIAANGINSRRVAVGVNTVLQIRACTDGLPVAFVVRGVLEQPDQAAALAFLRRIRHASGQAYTVGGSETVACLECSAGKVVPFVPFPGADRTWHTNHPLVNDDWSELFRRTAAGKGKEPADLRLRCGRFDAVARALGPGNAAGIDDVVGVLRARRDNVCNAGTYVCTVMVLGEEPELRIAPGPADRAEFQVFRMTPAHAVK
jgi:isopenicillin-N N-acyltransferase-like protein